MKWGLTQWCTQQALSLQFFFSNNLFTKFEASGTSFRGGWASMSSAVDLFFRAKSVKHVSGVLCCHPVPQHPCIWCDETVDRRPVLIHLVRSLLTDVWLRPSANRLIFFSSRVTCFSWWTLFCIISSADRHSFPRLAAVVRYLTARGLNHFKISPKISQSSKVHQINTFGSWKCAESDGQLKNLKSPQKKTKLASEMRTRFTWRVGHVTLNRSSDIRGCGRIIGLMEFQKKAGTCAVDESDRGSHWMGSSPALHFVGGDTDHWTRWSTHSHAIHHRLLGRKNDLASPPQQIIRPTKTDNQSSDILNVREKFLCQIRGKI